MPTALSADALDQIFREAHTAHAFTAQPLDDAMLRALVDLLKWGPTSMNCQPMRLAFVRSAEAKARLSPALSSQNRKKALGAPVVAILAYDMRFFEHLPTQAPRSPKARDTFAANAELAAVTALRNSSLQGAYLIVAARMLGLGAGPMSGFDAALVDAAFFPDGRFKSNFLVNLGYADPAGYRPRNPRLAFDEMARIV